MPSAPRRGAFLQGEFDRRGVAIAVVSFAEPERLIHYHTSSMAVFAARRSESKGIRGIRAQTPVVVTGLFRDYLEALF